jgi:hypothetical protein
MGRVVVHGVHRHAHLPVGQREEPADAGCRSVGQMQPQRLHQDHVGEVLDHQKAARLLSRNSCIIRSTAQRSAAWLGLVAQQHDRRQHPQQDVGVIAGKTEAAADQREVVAAVQRDDAALARGRENRRCGDRFQRQIGGQPERAAARQQEAVAGMQAHRIGHAVDR